MRKLPLRMCIGCRESFLQSELMRLVSSEEGPLIDGLQKMPGRGAYLCYRASCVETARKRQSLQRALKCPAQDQLWIDIDQAVQAAKREE